MGKKKKKTLVKTKIVMDIDILSRHFDVLHYNYDLPFVNTDFYLID